MKYNIYILDERAGKLFVCHDFNERTVSDWEFENKIAFLKTIVFHSSSAINYKVVFWGNSLKVLASYRLKGVVINMQRIKNQLSKYQFYPLDHKGLSENLDLVAFQNFVKKHPRRLN